MLSYEGVLAKTDCFRQTLNLGACIKTNIRYIMSILYCEQRKDISVEPKNKNIDLEMCMIFPL